MEKKQVDLQAEIPVPFASLPNACPDTVQQVGNGAVAVTVIFSITLLIRSITNLVKAKAE